MRAELARANFQTEHIGVISAIAEALAKAIAQFLITADTVWTVAVAATGSSTYSFKTAS